MKVNPGDMVYIWMSSRCNFVLGVFVGEVTPDMVPGDSMRQRAYYCNRIIWFDDYQPTNETNDALIRYREQYLEWVENEFENR